MISTSISRLVKTDHGWRNRPAELFYARVAAQQQWIAGYLESIRPALAVHGYFRFWLGSVVIPAILLFLTAE